MNQVNQTSLRAAPSFARLQASDRDAALEHLLALPDEDRRLRFGHSATDTIVRYLRDMDFEREIVLGAFAPRRRLVGLAHVPIRAGIAELGLSVAPAWRRCGVGLELARQAMEAACQSGGRAFRYHFAASNAGMQRIACALGLRVTRNSSEFIAQCALPGDCADERATGAVRLQAAA